MLRLLRMEFADRMQQRMKVLGLSGVDVQRLTGATSGTVSNWKNGVHLPRGTWLIRLAAALQCDTEWLLNGVIPKRTPEAQWIDTIEPWAGASEPNDGEVDLPYYDQVELSAGKGNVVSVEFKGPKLKFAKSTLARQGVDQHNAVCAKVFGDSMEPVLPHGSTVGVDMSCTSIIDGKMYALDHDGMLRVKMLYSLPGGGIRVRSYNSTEYPDEIYKGVELESISIIGKVFWYSVLV